MIELYETLTKIRAKVEHYRERRSKLTESDTIRVLILPVLQALGWTLDDIDEVRSEYRHQSSDNPVDYALFLKGEPVLFVEAKALDVSLEERKHIVQTLNYANTANVDWCVLTNGAEWRIYKVHARVEAEQKLFLTLNFMSHNEELKLHAKRLSLLSREHMGQSALSQLWAEHYVDRQVEAVLDGLSTDEGFIKLIMSRAKGLSREEVSASLRRAHLRSSYAQIGEVGPVVPEVGPVAPEVEPVVPEVEPVAPEPVVPEPEPSLPPIDPSKMRVKAMVERGLLPIGTVLTIKGSPGSEATVVSSSLVSYRGEEMKFHQWGCRVKGWRAIQIYAWAVLPNGELLESLRR